MRDLLPEDIAEHILESIDPPHVHDMKDKPWWYLESKGQFSVKSAWQYIRKKRQESKLYKFIWVTGLPFNILFFMWRLWKAKLLVYESLRRMEYLLPSRFWCCRNPKEKTFAYDFFTFPVARFMWKYFNAPAGINIEEKLLIQVIDEW